MLEEPKILRGVKEKIIVLILEVVELEKASEKEEEAVIEEEEDELSNETISDPGGSDGKAKFVKLVDEDAITIPEIFVLELAFFPWE